MRTWTMLVVVGLLGCGGDKGSDDPPPPDADTDVDVDTDVDADTDVDVDTDVDADTDADVGTADTGGATTAAAVCDRWETGRASLSQGTWSGDVGACDAGTLSTDGLDSVVELWSLYRELAGHGAVSHDPGLDALAQACALMQDANDYLEHFPEPTDACYTADGATGAGGSNIAGDDALAALDLYMADPGNAYTLGHRRWMLSNGLGVIGIGGTSRYSCHYVFGGGGGSSRDWTAWPPEGAVPIDVWSVSWMGLDETGWSVQSDVLPVGTATVTITRDDGQVLPVTVTELWSGYGSTHAISMIPDGWGAEAGRTYTVELSGLAQPVIYTVEPVDCSLY